MDAYWRAANYPSVGQIYLLDNPLLLEPLAPEHIKPRLLGHWGTTPGLNFIYAHMNRAILRHGLDVIFVMGPGHGGPAAFAAAYLERSRYRSRALSRADRLEYRRDDEATPGSVGPARRVPDDVGRRDLLAQAPQDERERFALELFVYAARKQLGAMIAVLGGIDGLVFTGGVGEGSPEIRAGICAPFAFAGLVLRPAAQCARGDGHLGRGRSEASRRGPHGREPHDRQTRPRIRASERPKRLTLRAE